MTQTKITPEIAREKMSAILNEGGSLAISEDNSKTGYPSFNTFAGGSIDFFYAPKEYRAALEALGFELVGTCGQDCEGCYARKLPRYPVVFENYLKNTLLIRNDLGRFYVEMCAWLDANEPDKFRIHDSGDFETYEYFKTWVKIAEAHPSTIFYTYTKEFDLLRRYLIESGDNMPLNLVINLSLWDGITDDGADLLEKRNAYGFRMFGTFYYDGDKNADGFHCPAVDKDGKRTGKGCNTCDACTHPTDKSAYPH